MRTKETLEQLDCFLSSPRQDGVGRFKSGQGASDAIPAILPVCDRAEPKRPDARTTGTMNIRSRRPNAVLR
jgi:hypothetical protein